MGSRSIFRVSFTADGCTQCAQLAVTSIQSLIHTVTQLEDGGRGRSKLRGGFVCTAARSPVLCCCCLPTHCIFTDL